MNKWDIINNILNNENISKIRISPNIYWELQEYFDRPGNMDIDCSLLHLGIINFAPSLYDNCLQVFYKNTWSPPFNFENIKDLNKKLELCILW